uniref:Chloride channel protein n=1 Tax=Ascaris lumbricoides TaxID=6252 RepID=A0A0M3I243_ASCLU
MLLDLLRRKIRVVKHVKNAISHRTDDEDVEKCTSHVECTNRGESITRRPQKIVRFIIEDWLFLIALGFTVALLSLAMETCIIELQDLRHVLMKLVHSVGDETEVVVIVLRFLAGVGYTTILVVAAAIFTHYVAPQAIGSGIPEMKTILRGVMLKEYLSLRTLIAKMVGLTLAIGSGLPIGKEGPFAHVGSIVANLFSRLVRSFQPIYANESRSCELLAAGCAVGVACTFSAPVGGVLFSIEVTAVYFAVRDYWRGFFAAACSSILFSLLRLYTQSSEVTVVAFYQTAFQHRSFVPEELFFFALIGLFCGVTGAIFIFLHRRLVLFLRRNRFMKIVFQKNWFVYPAVVSLLHAIIRYTSFLGQFMNGETVFNHKLLDFFKNCTWSANITSPYACPSDLIARWTGENGENSIFLELTLFMITFYFMCIIAVTLPVPAGIFMPVFVVGAAVGRLFGEIMAANFPNGIRGEATQILIYPGIYSVVAAAAFAGAVTHTVSVSIITFEMTGQLLHIVPVMIAVIIANIVSSALQPSFFDSLIMIKRLPYLPDIPKSASAVHAIRVEQIMVRNVKSLSKTSTYGELKELLDSQPPLHSFPVVSDPGWFFSHCGHFFITENRCLSHKFSLLMFYF